MNVPPGHKVIQEGRARILYPADEDGDVPAFYNPAQVFNRDLSCAVLEEFGAVVEQERKEKNWEHEPMTVIEALSASGLRACRYALECEGVKQVIANDLSVLAVDEIRKNAKFNQVDHLITPNKDDAIDLMARHRTKETNVDVIDLDPYGSACPFLDTAVQAVKHGGLLMVTCTDMGILAGNHPEACWAKYGCFPIKAHFCHEQAIRIVLHAIERAANRYGRYIEPLISLHLDFFIRVFVRVHHGKIHVKRSCTKIGYVCKDTFTHSFVTYPCGRLEETKNGGIKFHPGTPPKLADVPHAKKLNQAGPLWLAPMHNHDFIKRVQKRIRARDEADWVTKRRLDGLLGACLEELPDVPFYYHFMKDFGIVLKSSLGKMVTIRSAIINAGYRVSSSHATADVIKTDAPASALWDIFRDFLKGTKLDKVDPATPKFAILSGNQGTTKCSFEPATDPGWVALKSSLRFPVLPANWGPKAAARMKMDGNIDLEQPSERKERKRNKQAVAPMEQQSKRAKIRESQRLKRLEKKEETEVNPSLSRLAS